VIVSTLADALLRELDEAALEALAERLAPYLANGNNGDGWLRGADRIARYIDAPRSRVYALVSAGRIPVERDGSNLVARRSDLDAWVRKGGARRP
jgi:excisionase family DNA binding protein